MTSSATGWEILATSIKVGIACIQGKMLQVRFGVVHFVLALTLLQGPAGTAVLAEAAPQKHQANPSPLPLQPFDSSIVLGMEAHSTSSEEKSATDLAAKLLLLDELAFCEFGRSERQAEEGGGVAQATIWNSSGPNRNEPSCQHQGLADGASASALDD
ncbi:unnamed protein product [Caretta caretta]